MIAYDCHDRNARRAVRPRCGAVGVKGAFTLIELLVVVSIIAMLVGIMLPSLARAREQSRSVVCRSNLRQVALANTMYSQENRGRYCPGAADFRRNLHRWHGTRDRATEPFDPRRGPLVPYLGPGAGIRHCPSFTDFVADRLRAFERGNGGYGYNNAFVGVRLRDFGGGFYLVDNDRAGAQADLVGRPGETIMFADAALVTNALIEYSFAEPRFHASNGRRADPSIHFRHRGWANVAWCDGHVDTRRRTMSASSGMYRSDPARYDIGWFGQRDDNSLFDLK